MDRILAMAFDEPTMDEDLRAALGLTRSYWTKSGRMRSEARLGVVCVIGIDEGREQRYALGPQ